MRRLVAAVAVLLAVLLPLTTGCDPEDVRVPNATKVDVDTPALVKQKQAAGIADCVPGNGKPVEGGLPDVTLPCLGGGPDVDLASLRGPLVINLWGAWCGPCRAELPHVVEFERTYGDQVPVIGLDYVDTLPSAALDLLAKKKATYPQLADPGGEVAGRPPFTGRIGVPSSIFVDADGRATVVPVVIESVDQLVDLVRQHLGITL